MEKYAVIKLGSAQYTIRENDVFEVERQPKALTAEVLFYSDGENTTAGNLVLKDVLVKLSLVSEKRERKIMVGRFKSKSRYRKKRGSRQHLSVVKVDKISMAGEKKVEVEEKKIETKPVKAKAATTKAVKKETTATKSKKLPKKAVKK